MLKRLFFGMLLMVMGYSAVVSANVAPTVSITAPLNDVVMTPAPAAITLTASAADSDGSVSKVDFYDSGTLLGTDTVSPSEIELPLLLMGLTFF